MQEKESVSRAQDSGYPQNHHGRHREHPDATAMAADVEHTCPMHPDVRQKGPGKCPKCGMFLVPQTQSAHASHGSTHHAHQHHHEHHGARSASPTAGVKGAKEVEYTCPMHPQMRQMGPGSCPICGMALEPVLATARPGDSPELRDMTRRFWIGLALTVPVFALEMGGHLFDLHHFMIPQQTSNWMQLLFGTPVVLWAGWPFFVRGWAVAEEPQPEHVHADRAGHRGGLALQHRRHARAPAVSRQALRTADGAVADLLRGGGRHHGAGAARPSARAAGAREDLGSHPGPARPGARRPPSGCKQDGTRRNGAGVDASSR